MTKKTVAADIARLADSTEKQSLDFKARLLKIEAKQKEYDAKAADFISSGGGSGSPHIYIPGRTTSNSYEQKMLHSFGAKNLPDLLTKNAGFPGFNGVEAGMRLNLLKLKEAVDISRFISQIYYGDKLDQGEVEHPAACKNMLTSYYAREVLVPMLRAFGTGAAGEGAEWVPTGISTQFVEEFELEKRVAMIFRDMPLPTNPWNLSVQSGVTVARIAAEGTALTSANFGTAVISFDATKLGEFYALPEELNEDSAPAILAIARQEVVEAQVRARETIILNGDDSGGGHMDADVVAATDARKLAKGLRKLGLDNSGNGGDVNFAAGAVTVPFLDLMRNQGGKFMTGVTDLAYIFGPTGYNQAVALTEVSSVDQIGNNATLITGALANFRGIPVMISDFIREDLNASGVQDGITTDRTVCHLVNLRRYWVGVRRPIRSRVMMDLPDQDRWLLASYSRIDFKGHAQGATETSTVVGRNIQV